MKRTFALILTLAVCVLPVCAQPPGAGSGSRPAVAEASANDPSALAMRESQRLQKALGLNAKQTRKVYKLFYKHFRKETPQVSGFGGPQHHAGFGASGMGGFGGPGMGRPGGGEMRPEGSKFGTERPEMQEQRSDADPMRREDTGTWQKEQARKFRRIFTAGQYAAWEKLTARPPQSEDSAPGKPDELPEKP